MLDISSLILIIIYIGNVSTEYKIYSDGWVPVSREQIYNQIHRGAKTNLIYPTFESVDQITEELESIEPFDSEDNKQNIVTNSNIIDNINRNVSIPINLEDEVYENNEINAPVTASPRKAKNINYSNILSSFETSIVNDKIKEKHEKDKITELATMNDDKTVSYAVTEDIDDIDVSEKTNFNIKPTTMTENEDFNSKLINILSKYNIRTDDNLRNYDLSRSKIQNPMVIMRNWIPYRYNNFNHLPVDPLLADFLSNYGFYIPNVYRMKSNYNNLYGYLASNNIHNNKPFGLYKVFSDTDSWN